MLCGYVPGYNWGILLKEEGWAGAGRQSGTLTPNGLTPFPSRSHFPQPLLMFSLFRSEWAIFYFPPQSGFMTFLLCIFAHTPLRSGMLLLRPMRCEAELSFIAHPTCLHLWWVFLLNSHRLLHRSFSSGSQRALPCLFTVSTAFLS